MRVFVEVAAGTVEKHRYNERTLEYQETGRVLEPYPYPYGFVLGTAAEDGDAVDAFIITDQCLTPETIVDGEALGLLEMLEGDEVDHKVLIALPGAAHPPLESIRDTLETFILAIFRQFPDVEVRIGRVLPAADAAEHIRRAQRSATAEER
jgi:inorganic pyrophosphatase